MKMIKRQTKDLRKINIDLMRQLKEVSNMQYDKESDGQPMP